MKASASASTKSRRPKGRAPATFAAKTRRAAAASTLILFDIDGTLVLTGGAGGRAMSLAFEEAFAVRNALQGVPMAGRTDAWILNDAAAAHGLSPGASDLSRFHDRYLHHLAIEL